MGHVMFFIFLLLNFLNSSPIISMHTPKVSSFSTINHNNVSLNPLTEEKLTHATPRSQTCKVIRPSAESSRAQSFEVNHKEAKPVERRLTYSSFSDDEIEQAREQETFQAIEANSLEKRVQEKTNNNLDVSNTAPQKPPLSSPVIDDSQMLEKSIRKEEKNPEHNFSIEELKAIKPYSIEKLDTENLKRLLSKKEKYINIGALSIEDIITESLLEEDEDDIIYNLNDFYRFLGLKDSSGNYVGWLIYSLSDEDSSIIVKLCLINKQLKIDNIKELHFLLENICQELKYKSITVNPLKEAETKFYEQIGYKKIDSLGTMKKTVFEN